MRTLSTFFLVSLMLLSASAIAADDKAAKALQRAQQKAQSLEQEKTRLTAEKTQMQDDLKKAQDDASRVKSASAAKLGTVQKELAALQVEKQRLSDELGQLKAQAIEQQNSATAQARMQQSNLQVSQDILLAKSKQLVQCENKNLSLYQINTDLLSRYEQAYKSAYLMRGGVFTQLGTVKLENDNAQERDKLQGLRVTDKAQ